MSTSPATPPPLPTAPLNNLSLQDATPTPPAQADLVSTLPAELRSQIAHYLLHHDLASLSFVSKDWHRTCLPFLWRYISILIKRQWGKFMSKEGADGLRKFGCFTRVVRTRFPENVWPFLEVEFLEVQQELLKAEEEEEGGEGGAEKQVEVDGEGNRRIQLERFDLLLAQDADALLSAANNDTDPDPIGRNVILTNQSSYILLCKFLQSTMVTTTLRTLHIYRVPHNPIRLLETIVSHLQGLRELHLFAGGSGAGIVPFRRMPCLGPEAVRMFLESCPSGLKELVFGAKVKGDQPPELCSLVVPSELQQSRSTRTHPNLRILSLPGAMNGYEEQVLAAGEGGFLQGCTALEVIESPNDAYLRNYWITDNVTIRNVLSEGVARPVTLNGRVLKRFCASAEDTGLPPDPALQQQQQQSAVNFQLQQQQQTAREMDPSVRDELLSGSILAIQATNLSSEARKEAWHTIVVHGAGPLVAQAIALTSSQQQDALVALDLIDPRGVTGTHIQQILIHSKSLRSLEIRHSDIPGSFPLQGTDFARTRILATDVMSSPISWRCLLLTTLHLEIGGIPRRASEDKDGDSFDVSASYRIQRQVYRQLAALTRLQDLRLGRACDRQDIEEHEVFHLHLHQQQQDTNLTLTNNETTNSEETKVPGFQRDCLEMSLESGLDILSSLTDLAVLDLSRMDHRIGGAELQWMLRSWPNLRTLRGVKT
ncbi:hypothetical protein BGW39_006535 [Mortierella sp. 14UC]|nr:hypothetical protein BGW39_006535 [Mortierella sp. 14UC]